MQVAPVKMNRDKAYELYKAYKRHQNYEKPEDYEIMRTYQLISQGKVVIQAWQSIKNAGVDSEGLPRLAIVRADACWCYLEKDQWGGGSFSGVRYPAHNSRSVLKFERGFFPQSNRYIHRWNTVKALVPIIPPQYRPKRALENYHILWEAEWQRTPPVDPYLLRKIGNSDMWVVLAAWDLTPVERAVMSTKLLVN